MLNCQKLPQLSASRSQMRIANARALLGPTGVARIVVFALYLLGASRRALAEFAEMRSDTVKALTKRVLTDGLPALEDRRRKHSTFLPHPTRSPLRASLKEEEDGETLVAELSEEIRIKIPRRNPVQCRTVLLTLLDGGLLSADDVASGLGLSKDHVRALGAKLRDHDALALADQRRGTQRDRQVTPEVRAELIQQYVFNAATNASTSSRQLAVDLDQRCNIELPDRTIRLHVAKLGLRGIGSSLRQLLSEAKKNSAGS